MALQIKIKKLGVFPAATTWFNNKAEIAPEPGAYLHTFYQSISVSRFVGADCISEQDFKTTAVNLSLDENELLGKMDSKSCRYEIRKIQKLIDQSEKIVVGISADYDNFLKIANRYIQEKKYTSLLTRNNLNIFLDKDAGELFTLYYNDELVGGNFYVKSYPERVRLLYSYNNRFQNKELMAITGALMRYFHWNMMKHYKAEGYKWYDFGGINLDVNSPVYGISKFKLSFGGDIVDEKTYVLVPRNMLGKIYLFLKQGRVKTERRDSA